MITVEKIETGITEKRSVAIPKKVTVSLLSDKHIQVKGPKGTLERKFERIPTQIVINKKSNSIEIFDYFVKRKQKALVGTISSHIANMFRGVLKPYVYKLKIIYSHFPITVQIKGKTLEYTGMYGMRDHIKIPVPDGVKVKVQGEDIICEGIDIENVSQFAARVEQSTRLRGKRAKDPRIFQDGIYIFEKDVTKDV